MDFGGIYYPWLHLWMLSAIPLVTFCLGILSWIFLRWWTLAIVALGILGIIWAKVKGA